MFVYLIDDITRNLQ